MMMDDIKILFDRLTNRGYLAKMRHLCCSGCATSDIAQEVEQRVSLGEITPENFRGAVFFHEQDQDYWEQTGELMLRYGPVRIGHKVLGLPGVEIGHEIVQLATALRLPVSWSGKSTEVISIGKED